MFYLILGIILFVLIAIAVSCIKRIRQSKYIDFLTENSIVLEKLEKINADYKFYEDIKSFDDEHTYDNENFYENISCRDYLIYQLQFSQREVEKAIKCVDYNKSLYDKYCQEISGITGFGEYKHDAIKMNKKYLSKVEKSLFDKNRKRVQTKFCIEIKLNLSKINGVVYEEKTQVFDPEEIESLIKMLNDKRYNFYNNREVWEAICRVERGKVSNKMRFSIYKRDGYRCCICGRKTDDLEIDHIKPIAKGGKSVYSNLQTLCHNCNKKKGDSY